MEQNERSQRALCGFQPHKGENLFCFLFSDPIIVGLKPAIIVPENRKQNGISLHRTETREQCRRQCWVISDRCLHKKKRAFRTWHFTAATSPCLTGHGSPPNLASVCSTKLKVLAAKFEGRRWCVPRGLAWDVGPWPISGCFFF